MADPESGSESGREPSRRGLFGELYRHQDDAVAPDGIEFIAFTIGESGSGKFQAGINVKNRIGRKPTDRFGKIDLQQPVEKIKIFICSGF